MYGCIGQKANFERKFSVNLKENRNIAVDWPLVHLLQPVGERGPKNPKSKEQSEIQEINVRK